MPPIHTSKAVGRFVYARQRSLRFVRVPFSVDIGVRRAAVAPKSTSAPRGYTFAFSSCCSRAERASAEKQRPSPPGPARCRTPAHRQRARRNRRWDRVDLRRRRFHRRTDAAERSYGVCDPSGFYSGSTWTAGCWNWRCGTASLPIRIS